VLPILEQEEADEHRAGLRAIAIRAGGEEGIDEAPRIVDDAALGIEGGPRIDRQLTEGGRHRQPLASRLVGHRRRRQRCRRRRPLGQAPADLAEHGPGVALAGVVTQPHAHVTRAAGLQIDTLGRRGRPADLAQERPARVDAAVDLKGGHSQGALGDDRLQLQVRDDRGLGEDHEEIGRRLTQVQRPRIPLRGDIAIGELRHRHGPAGIAAVRHQTNCRRGGAVCHGRRRQDDRHTRMDETAPDHANDLPG